MHISDPLHIAQVMRNIAKLLCIRQTSRISSFATRYWDLTDHSALRAPNLHGLETCWRGMQDRNTFSDLLIRNEPQTH